MAPRGSSSFPRPTPASRAFVINGPTYSDGDPSQRCTRDNASLTPVYAEPYQAYLIKIATKWIDEEAGGAEPGKVYTLPGLPNGYTLWERPRPTNPKHIDRWLYGHPSNKYFDSPIKFYPHWKWLLDYGSGQACRCDLCGSNPAKPRSRRSVSSTGSVTKPRGRISIQRPLQSGAVDEEGTPDVYRSLFSLLKSEGQLKRKIEEQASLDWRAEKPLVDRFASNIPHQPSFLPRQGDIVLYLSLLPPHLVLRRDPTTQHFRIYNTTSNTYSTSAPQWQAGIVTQVPAITPPIASLTTPPSDSDLNSLSTTGYQISPLSSPFSTHKLLAKQHTYVPLSLIRPFSLHAQFLSGIPLTSYHPSITNALTLSSTVSLIDKHSFSGTWPTVRIHSRGVFIGYESYWRGDTVVLLPHNPAADPIVAEILRITDIVTTFHNLQPSPNNDIGEITPSSARSITITLHGHIYTAHPTRSLSGIPVPHDEYTTPMLGYGSWFHLEHPTDIWSAPFTRVLSRLYELDAIQAWLNPPLPFPASSSSPSHSPSSSLSFLPINNNNSTNNTTPSHPNPSTQSLDLGRQATLSARHHAASTDERIILASGKQKKSWLWADHRAAALDLPQLGGLDVGRWDGERETGVWREVLGVLDGRASAVSASGGREWRSEMNGKRMVEEVDGSEMNGKRRFEEVDGSEDDEAFIEGLIRGEGLEHADADTDADELGHGGSYDGDEGMRRKKPRMETVEVKVPVVVLD